MISLSARGGIDIYTIVDQLKSCGTCPSYAVRNATKHDTSKGSCCPMAVGNALLDMYEEMQQELGLKEDDNDENKINNSKITVPVKMSDDMLSTDTKPKCPECGEPLVFEGGCNTCKNCGWSKCE